jgi:hypothetical protein
LFLLSLVAAGGCANPIHNSVNKPSAFCEVNGYVIRTDFSSAALHACSSGEKGPVVTVAPEFSPINPSPWYAYRIEADPTSNAPATVTITQNYLLGQHRYNPWTRQGNGEWQAVAASAQTLSEDRTEFAFTLELPPAGLQVAAQPLLTVAESEHWSAQLASKHHLQTQVLAHTSQGHKLQLYENSPRHAQGMILLLGRQHPPELTGAYAYQDFIERLFEPDQLARDFRQRYRLALVPLVNPDGVANGYWRMNRGGMDLNRDWGPFTQPETRAIGNWVEQAVKTTPLTLLLDFHSTWNDVFYGQHPSDNPTPVGFNQAWYQAISARLGEETPAWSGQHNPGLPTAKSWARRVYGVSALTYEVGDRTPRDVIHHKAWVSAEELMRTLMSEEFSQHE